MALDGLEPRDGLMLPALLKWTWVFVRERVEDKPNIVSETGCLVIEPVSKIDNLHIHIRVLPELNVIVQHWCNSKLNQRSEKNPPPTVLEWWGIVDDEMKRS